jgi:dTDP-4-dehydrorhamnose reductase
MRHAIFGAGNLGYDLMGELQRADESVALFTRSNGFDVRRGEDLIRVLERGRFDYVWYCVGAGSVGDAVEDPDLTRWIHVTMPLLLAEHAPPACRLVFFSSDHAADEANSSRTDRVNAAPRSEFAQQKVDLETKLLATGRPLTAVVRVGSLYGIHKPGATFPGKLLARFGFGEERIRLPANVVTPTPTLWLAAMLAQHRERILSWEGPTIHHCAPNGNVTVWDWATFILDGLRPVEAFDRARWYDEARPLWSALGCSFVTENWHWFDIWRTYFRRRSFTPTEHLPLLPLDTELSRMRETQA